MRETEAELRASTAARREAAGGASRTTRGLPGNLVGHAGAGVRDDPRVRRLGCTYFVPWCADYPDDTTLRMFAEQVMPEFG